MNTANDLCMMCLTSSPQINYNAILLACRENKFYDEVRVAANILRVRFINEKTY